jgi:flagellar hook-length control protein FliK
MSLIEVLTNPAELKINNKPNIKPSENFILHILQEMEPEKALDLLKNLNLTQNEIKEIISKLPPQKRDYFLNLLNQNKHNTKTYKTDLPELDKENINKNTDKSENLITQTDNSEKENLNTPKLPLQTLNRNHFNKYNNIVHKKGNENVPDSKKEDTKTYKTDLPEFDEENINKNTDKSENLITQTDNSEKENLNSIVNLLLKKDDTQPEIKKEIKDIKKNITELIKKEIEANIKKDNNLLTKKIITEIKNSNSFEELVKIANKNGLNIKEVIIKNIKTANLKQPQPLINTLLKKSFSLKQPKFNEKTKPVIFKNQENRNNTNNTILQNLLSHKYKTNPENINNIKKEIKNINDINENIDKIKTKTKKNHEENKKEINISTNYNNQNMEIKEIKHKIVSAKESIKHFSKTLKEAVENYKPPVSKLSMELHPKDLGKVDITIVHRGNNLQINITSNNQAISFFHTNQIELKNALINMGYSGIDMSFNSNQNKENNEKKAYKQYLSNKKDENYDELTIEIPYTYA